jgi:T6SS, Phospholipase effector Tle1-like, catalytic domain
MAKNIVVFSDGTGQDGGARPEQRISNIYKMYRSSRDHADTGIDPSQQVVFYDAGLGTDIGATALTAPIRFVQKLLGSVMGAGIKRNIADCYEFIINHYQAGDRIFLFGFSRGAYTVRSLANLLMLCGVPTKAGSGPLMRFRKIAAILPGKLSTLFLSMARDIRGRNLRQNASNSLAAFKPNMGLAMDLTRTPPLTSSECSTRSRLWARAARDGSLFKLD